MTDVPNPFREERGRDRRRLVRLALVVLVGLLIVELGVVAADWWATRAETARTTPRYDPPVWAGQIVPGACSGGFYARQGQTIVLTIVGHCAAPGGTLRDAQGHLIGSFGRPAQLAECPPTRFCAPSDFLALALAPQRIPWGHLNVVDMGAGGYRTIPPGTKPLACTDIKVGDRVEIDGREHYRTGRVVEIGPYAHEIDLIFPCMVVADISLQLGDSGAAVLVNDMPAGVVSRAIAGMMGFTPLAEGLDNLGLVLCTTPDCDQTPP